MQTRALVIWFGLLLLASVNGFIREAVLIPQLGAAPGRAISALLLSVLVLAVSWFTLPWIRPRSIADTWAIGAVWVTLTLSFEFLAGHYLFGHPWPELLADYNVLQGRIWILVLVTVTFAPRVCAAARRLVV